MCENNLAVHWISLCVCVHVSHFLFGEFWDLFHLHSFCHVGLNVSDCCSFHSKDLVQKHFPEHFVEDTI